MIFNQELFLLTLHRFDNFHSLTTSGHHITIDGIILRFKMALSWPINKLLILHCLTTLLVYFYISWWFLQSLFKLKNSCTSCDWQYLLQWLLASSKLQLLILININCTLGISLSFRIDILHLRCRFYLLFLTINILYIINQFFIFFS